jgi:hypothetical protein
MTVGRPLAGAGLATVAPRPQHKRERNGCSCGHRGERRPPRNSTRNRGTVIDRFPGSAGITQVSASAPDDPRNGGRLEAGPAAAHDQSGEVSGSQHQHDNDPHDNQCAEAQPFEKRITEAAGVAVTRGQHARPGTVGLVVEQAHRRGPKCW